MALEFAGLTPNYVTGVIQLSVLGLSRDYCLVRGVFHLRPGNREKS